jgi:sporadic carbohydrate cluster protein (TIGR04323 family)
MIKIDKYVTYTNLRNFDGFHLPAPVQNLILRDYCHNNNYNFSIPIEEYIFEDCYVELEGIISNLKKNQNVIICSSRMLPFKQDYINYLIDKFITKKSELHIVLEKKKLKTKKDFINFFEERSINNNILEISLSSINAIKKYLDGNINYRR